MSAAVTRSQEKELHPSRSGASVVCVLFVLCVLCAFYFSSHELSYLLPLKRLSLHMYIAIRIHMHVYMLF